MRPIRWSPGVWIVLCICPVLHVAFRIYDRANPPRVPIDLVYAYEAHQDEVTEKALREQIHAAIREAKWAEAKKKITELSRLDRSRLAKEVKSLRTWIKGRQAFLKIAERIDDGKLPGRAALAQLEALQQKYGSTTQLVLEMHERRELLLEQLYHLLDDFEWPDREAPEGTRITESPAHWGKRALSWKNDAVLEHQWSVYPRKVDWTDVEALVFWVHASKPGQVFEVRCWTEKGGAHLGSVKVRWTGWKEVRMPLLGKKSPFRSNPGATWDDVSSIQFYKEESMKIDVSVDDIMLEKRLTSKSRQ